ncbi:MAG: LysM peptidoglycan-binding domain-containing protein [Paracoccaceae bacterium]
MYVFWKQNNGVSVGLTAAIFWIAVAYPLSASTIPPSIEFIDEVKRTNIALRYAQAGSLADLKPSALRRLRFYSDIAITALLELANEDKAAASGAAINNETTDTLRTAIERLIGAGAKSGLDIDQTAAFFTEEVSEWFSGDLPLVVQDADGKLDARTLFQGVALSKSRTTTSNAEADYIALVTAQGVTAQNVSRDSPDDTLDVTEEPAVIAEEPEEIIRDPAVQAFWDRLENSDDKRIITVIKGDTLAAYAAAFYGDSLQYRRVFQANQDIMQSPNFLEVGQIIIIPEG